MESEIRTIQKSKLRKVKKMSPYQIDDVVLLGFGISNNKEGEEKYEETETLQQE